MVPSAALLVTHLIRNLMMPPGFILLQQPPFLIFSSFSQSSPLPMSPPISLSPLHPLVFPPSESVFTCLVSVHPLSISSGLCSFFGFHSSEIQPLTAFLRPPAHPSTVSQSFLCSVIDSLFCLDRAGKVRGLERFWTDDPSCYLEK